MKTLLKFGLPVLILAVCAGLGMALILSSPKAERRPPPRAVPTVEVIRATPSAYTVFVPSRGMVSPRTESTLIPEVSGRVVALGENFTEGGFFEAGELLLQLDPRDYENAVIVARADLAQAQARFEEERARAEQAKKDWQALKLSEAPGELTLRKPQMKSAKAAVAAAEARLAQAQVNLERTSIRAPYAGRVLEAQVDVGQYVSPGGVLAKVFAVDVAEIRLPLAGNQMEFVDLPETYRDDPQITRGTEFPEVELISRVGERIDRWRGRIVRTEGAVDTQSQQLFVVARVEDPYARRDGGAPLKIGQFVEASIRGGTFRDVFVLPRVAVQSPDQVLIVNDQDQIERRDVDILWSDHEQVVIRDGLNNNDRVVVTALPYAVNGAKVSVSASGATGSQP